MKKIQGDLVEMALKGDFDVIIHGCNCRNMMGAGIAAQIARGIPEAVWADTMFIHLQGYDKLSNYSTATFRNEKNVVGFVVNLYTQYNPGANLDENALLLGFTKLKNTLMNKVKIGIPLIGCGIAGGDWKKLEPKIKKIMKGHDITVVHYKK